MDRKIWPRPPDAGLRLIPVRERTHADVERLIEDMESERLRETLRALLAADAGEQEAP